MEFKSIEQLYSSEHSHIFLVEGSDGRLYTKKDRGISPDVADKLRGVKSPYVAALADHGDNFTILEYAQGTPLNDLKLTPGRACEIFRELCDGVSALHRVGILHRDIKPSNVIVCDDGHIKIIDFDAARIKKPAADKDTVFIGTDGFAPPEQFGFTQTDERSDIYALGITLKVVLGEKYQNSRYRRIIKKCIRFNPEQRYRSIEDVKKAITFNDCVLGSIALAVRYLKCIIHANLSKNNIPDETFNDQISIHNTSATDRERKILIEEPSTKRIIINRFQKDILDENALSTQTMKTKHIIFNNEKTVKSTSYTLSISSAPIQTRIPPRVPSLIISVRSVSLPQVKPPSSMIIKQTDFKTIFDSRQK